MHPTRDAPRALGPTYNPRDGDEEDGDGDGDGSWGVIR